LFEVTIFSSNSGIVKPSPRPFLQALERMQAYVQDALVIGDSVRRDLGGAVAAGLPCLLVGGATHSSAYSALPNILTLVDNDF
jgi:FMN phosphatase YigB (HAD superfamily)